MGIAPSIADSGSAARQLAAAVGGRYSALELFLAEHRPYGRLVIQRRISLALRARIDPSDVVQETHAGSSVN